LFGYNVTATNATLPRKAVASLKRDQRWSFAQLATLGILPQMLLLRTEYKVLGVQCDITDAILLPLLLVLLLNSSHRKTFSRMPYLRLWLVYGIILSFAYINGRLLIGDDSVLDPVRLVYQLYRYTWKALLFYPLVFVLFQDKRKMKVFLCVLVCAIDILALIAIRQGYEGNVEVTGSLNTKNVLGGVLIIPVFVTLAMSLNSESKKDRLFYGLSFLLICRALLFTQSRGAALAFVVSVLLLLLIMSQARLSKKNVRLLAMGVLGAAVLIVLFITIFNKGSSLQRYFATVENLEGGHEDANLTWRMRERWPYFFWQAINNPLLGVGTDVNWEFGPDTNTPHNGYLSIAVTYGIPSLLLFLCFIIIAVRKSFLVIKKSPDMFSESLGLGIVCGVVALSLHNIVDVTFTGLVMAKIVWITFGLAIVSALGVVKSSRRPNVAPIESVFARDYVLQK
jgi:O-antigen ligase